MVTVENATNKKYDRLPREAREILQSLATKWGDEIDSSALQMIPLKGAMTNEVFQIKWPTKKEDVSRKVLVRIYGEGVDVFLNREDEIRTFEFISKQGQGPRLLGRFSTGRIEEFIRARTLSAVDLLDSEISSLIAIKMKEFHNLDIPGPKNVCLWNRLRNWLTAAKKISPPEEAKAFRLDSMEEEISALEKDLFDDHQTIGFCHNDVQYGNIMLDEETRSITIIDYEYANYNPIAFDIANHFCEMTADYHTDTPHVLVHTKYPGLEERKRFLQQYLSASGRQPSDAELMQLVQDVEKYTLASHLVWGLWGIISEHVNDIDFDYIKYARQRFERYWTRKHDLLGKEKTTRD
ncbi:probable choline kinase 2 [Cucurbita maxima]|uniref:Probable choline kinase 2 n=1 Tax=Cucurbita maxima TaxID=3661 RepID=A0A6J1JSE3_CUCMA|nr:probable choline kinase 2 [Cucurbita maxima]